MEKFKVVALSMKSYLVTDTYIGTEEKCNEWIKNIKAKYSNYELKFNFLKV